jgi:outer membrane receptor for ferrienterochelin and colicins
MSSERVTARLARRAVLANAILCAFGVISFSSAAGPQTVGQITPDAVDHLFDVSLDELLNQTVTTATKTPERLSETPATVRVVTAEQIRRRGYMTLSDLLADLPGIQFRDIQGFNSYVFMRGAPSQNNLILLLVDGVEINELNSGGFYGGYQFNLANVKRVEIVYGPASTLYGTNAGSGVINIITKDPQDEDGRSGAIAASIGSFNTGGGSFRTAAYDREKRVGYSLSGMYATTDKMDLGGTAGDNSWTRGMQNFERCFSFDGKLAWENVTLGFLFQDKEASRTTNYKTVDANKLDRDTLWHITFMNLWGKHNHAFSPDVTLQSLVWYRDATVADDTIGFIDVANATGPGRQAGYYRPNSQYGIEEQLNVTVCDTLELIGGISWEQERLAEGFSRTNSDSQDQAPPTPPKPDMLTDELLSGYVQAQWMVRNDLKLTAGVRGDHSTVYDDVITPRSGLVYQRDRLTAKLLYSEAYRAPKPWDYSFGAGNANLDPEEVTSYEGALSYKFSKHFHAGVSVYRNEIDHLLAFNPSGDRWENHGEATTDGLEVSADYSWQQWIAYFNYTFNDSEDDTGSLIPEIAEHDANIGVTWNMNRHWTLDMRGEYVGERSNPTEIASTGNDKIDEAFLLHGNVGWGWRNWYVNLAVRNALDETWYHTSNRPPDRYRQAERSVLLRAEYAF